MNLFSSPVKQLHKSGWSDAPVFVIALFFISLKSAGLITYTITSVFLEAILYAVTIYLGLYQTCGPGCNAFDLDNTYSVSTEVPIILKF